MAQNPTVVGQSGGGGDAVVAEINAAIVAVQTFSYGPNDPAETGVNDVRPGYVWTDTSATHPVTGAAAIKVRDAANAAWVVIGYVDGRPATAAQALLDLKLALSGGTMTGDLELAGDPDAALKAATKQYVDSVSRPAPVRFFQLGNASVQQGVAFAIIEQNCNLTDIVAAVLTAPVGADLIVTITRFGQSGSASRSATIVDGTTFINAAVTPLAFVPGDFARFDISQVGSTTPGGNPIAVTGKFGT